MLKSEGHRHLHLNDEALHSLMITDNREAIRNEIEFLAGFGKKVVVYCVVFDTKNRMLLLNPPKPELERDFLRLEIPLAQKREGDKAAAQRIYRELNVEDLLVCSLRSITPAKPLPQDDSRLKISIASRVNFFGKEPLFDSEKYNGYTWVEPTLRRKST